MDNVIVVDRLDEISNQNKQLYEGHEYIISEISNIKNQVSNIKDNTDYIYEKNRNSKIVYSNKNEYCKLISNAYNDSNLWKIQIISNINGTIGIKTNAGCYSNTVNLPWLRFYIDGVRVGYTNFAYNSNAGGSKTNAYYYSEAVSTPITVNKGTVIKVASGQYSNGVSYENGCYSIINIPTNAFTIMAIEEPIIMGSNKDFSVTNS